MFGRFATVQCGNWTSGGGSKNVENFEQLRVTLQVTMNILGVLAGVAGALVLPCGAVGQSFNIDMDVFAGPEEGGNGAPGSSFGAAANQPGFWNRIDAASHTRPWSLHGLNGSSTSVDMRWNVSGGGAGSGWIGNTGDYRALLNDCTPITVPTTYVFENLAPGRYAVTTYAVDRSGNAYPTRVTIMGAAIPVRISGNNGMPGDELIEGTTHCVHHIDMTGTTLTLRAESVFSGPRFGSINGFQITYTPVPEPVSILSLLVGGTCLLSRRRDSRFLWNRAALPQVGEQE